MPPSNAVGLACGRSLEGCATIPKRTPAAFATGISAATTINADNGVSAISNPVVNLSSTCASLLSGGQQIRPPILKIHKWNNRISLKQSGQCEDANR
jgi:hypothetical protein